jgi:hypothetical protein
MLSVCYTASSIVSVRYEVTFGGKTYSAALCALFISVVSGSTKTGNYISNKETNRQTDTQTNKQTNKLTNKLTPWSRVLEKLTVPQLLKKFPALY